MTKPTEREENPSVRLIIRAWLMDHGYDGLYGDECGCGLDSLAPCDSPHLTDCRAGYKRMCPGERCPRWEEDCEFAQPGEVRCWGPDKQDPADWLKAAQEDKA